MKDRSSAKLTLPSRRALAALPLALLARPGAAQAFPAGPVRVIVPFPARQSTDILTRLFTEVLARRWGQPIDIVNHRGQGGGPGTEQGARAAPDGHTLLMGTINTLAIDPANLPGLPYRVPEDFTMVSGIFTTPFAVVVNAGEGAASLADLLARARREPGRMVFTSNGFGTATHMVAEWILQQAGVRMRHRGLRVDAAVLRAVVDRQADMTVAVAPAAQPHVRAGRLRALAVTAGEASPILPGVPAVAATLPGVVAGLWGAMVGPAGLPDGLAARIHADVAAVLAEPAVQRGYARYGVTPMPLDPASLAEMLKVELTRWRAVGAAARATPQD
jgi:tripartite-type tricarboxylate transporter receptor subunit TctC